MLLALQTRPGQAKLVGQVLELAAPGLLAGHAIQGMIGQDEFHHQAAGFEDPLGAGVNLHPPGNREGTGGGQAPGSFHLHQADPAGAAGA
jgi:hypothetical protein